MENNKMLETIISHLVDLRGDVKEIKQDVSELKQDISELKTRVTNVEHAVSELKEDVSELKEDVSGLKEDVSGLKEDVSGLKEDVSGLKQTVARIEHDHGNQLKAVLDGYQQNAVILDRHTEQLERIEAKIENHDIKISVLDRTKSNRRKVAK